MKKFFKDITPNKIFILFLILHLIVWSTIGLIRTVMPTDALEGIYWGGLHDFGTPKHPNLQDGLVIWFIRYLNQIFPFIL